MYIKSSEYLSKFTGKQIDNAIEGIRDYDAELALKADKSTTVNGQSLAEDVVLTAEDVGALPADTNCGTALDYENGYISLLDANGVNISSQFILPSWGEIQGDDLSENAVLQAALDSKQDKVTAQNMLSSDLVDDTNKVHRFASAEQLTQIVTNQADIVTINSKIPAQASSSNQLADKNFVNSTVTTNTSFFIGTFQSLEDLEAYSGTVTNNDYGFVETHDQAGNTFYDKYKYNSNTSSWLFEYEINNSSFTAAQWAALNSNATQESTAQITTNKNAIASINDTLGTFGNIVTRNASEFASSAQGSLAGTALQPGDNISELTNNLGFISGIDSSDVTTALGFTPYNASNPDGFIDSSALAHYVQDSREINGKPLSSNVNLSASDVGALPDSVVIPTISDIYDATSSNGMSGIAVASALSNSGFISGINSNDVITALGYTPYSSSNPDGFIDSSAVGDGTITFTQGGVNKGTITMNQSEDVTISLDGAPSITVDQTYDPSSANAQSGIAINGAGFLNNTATGTGSLTLIGTANTNNYSINIGYGSSTSDSDSVAIGYGASSGQYSVAIGSRNASATGLSSISIGDETACSGNYSICIGGTNASGTHSIQLGAGTNSTANSLQVESYQLLNTSTGLIPDARISVNMERTANKVTSLSTSSTDTQYPSAKATFDNIKATQTIQDMQALTNSSSVTISLSRSKAIYTSNPTMTTTYSFSTTNLSLTSSISYTFELYVNMATVYGLNFPSTVKWQDGESPDLSSTGKYLFAFRTMDAGATWLGNLQGRWL